MLFAAALLVAIAVIIFALDFWRGELAPRLVSLGLGFFAGGFLCFLLDILHSQGKI